jgi:hypothetical protein
MEAAITCPFIKDSAMILKMNGTRSARGDGEASIAVTFTADRAFICVLQVIGARSDMGYREEAISCIFTIDRTITCVSRMIGARSARGHGGCDHLFFYK